MEFLQQALLETLVSSGFTLLIFKVSIWQILCLIEASTGNWSSMNTAATYFICFTAPSRRALLRPPCSKHGMNYNQNGICDEKGLQYLSNTELPCYGNLHNDQQ